MDEVWLRGVDVDVVLLLERSVLKSTMRVAASRINARVSESILSGRRGREGGGPKGLVNGTVDGMVGMVRFKDCSKMGRDIDRWRTWAFPRDERKFRVENEGGVGLGGVVTSGSMGI